jgi:tetratricopeptide (TPR) repeat protein
VKRFAIVALGIGCFASGVLVGPLLAHSSQARFSLEEMQAKEPKDAAAFLLDGALQRAENGSWERIAVARAWYLGGDKDRGQKILDQVTTNRSVESSDFFRVGRVYAEAGEWEKAKAAFERSITMKPSDDSGRLEYGAWANLNKDRAKAEQLFQEAFRKNPREFWHWVTAGASYLGVRPQ